MDDIEAACNIIKTSHKKDKKNKTKGITISLFKENKKQVSAILLCKYIKNTGNISFAHALRYFSCNIYPTTNETKLKCINEAGLLMLEKHRESNKNYISNKRNIVFNKIIKKGLGIVLVERIHYNENTGDVSCNCRFKSEKKLLRIDII